MKRQILSHLEQQKSKVSNSIFLVWTGPRPSAPSKLRVNIYNFKTVIDSEKYKCKNFYYHLIKFKYEKPRKWDKLGQEFHLREDQLSEAYLLPSRVANEPYVRSFQYKVLNYILFTNDRPFKIGYVSNPNCTFCQESRETIHHILFECSFSKCFWNMVSSHILNRLGSCGCLSIHDIMIGVLKEGMDLINYIVILRKTYLSTCRSKGINPNFIHFKRILEIKYETEKYIAFKANNISQFKRKWEVFEVFN